MLVQQACAVDRWLDKWHANWGQPECTLRGRNRRVQRPSSLRLGSGYGPVKPGMLCARVSLGVQQETCCWQFSDNAAGSMRGCASCPLSKRLVPSTKRAQGRSSLACTRFASPVSGNTSRLKVHLPFHHRFPTIMAAGAGEAASVAAQALDLTHHVAITEFLLDEDLQRYALVRLLASRAPRCTVAISGASSSFARFACAGVQPCGTRPCGESEQG